MSVNTRRVALAAWAALIVVVATGVVTVCRSTPTPPEAILKDGSILRLEGVGYRALSAELPARRWIAIGRAWLAQALRRPNFDDSFAPPGSLVYWVSRRDEVTGRPVPMNMLWSGAAIDSHGCEFSVANMSFASGSRLRPADKGATVSAGALSAFPRRDRQLTIRFYERGQVMGELKVPNPVYRRHPNWTPESLPARRLLGGSNVTLVSFDNFWGTARFVEPDRKQFTLTPEFQVPAAWELGAVDIADATGNCSAPDWPPRFGPSPRQGVRRPPWEALSAQFGLCTNEQAWKLTAAFYRKPDAVFSAKETWSIAALPLPAPGVLRPLGISSKCAGVSVRLCAIAGPGEVSYSNGVPVGIVPYSARTIPTAPGPPGPRGPGSRLIPVASDKPQLLIETSGLEHDRRCDVLVGTSHGVAVCLPRMWSNNYRVLILDADPDASAVDLRVVVQQPQVVQFYIQPKARIDDSPAPWRRSRFGPGIPPRAPF